MGGLVLTLHHMGTSLSPDQIRTPETVIPRELHRGLSSETLLASYSDLMYTSLADNVSSDERHELMLEIRRRGLTTGFIETPRYLREQQRAEELRQTYSNLAPSLIEWAKKRVSSMLPK